MPFDYMKHILRSSLAVFQDTTTEGSTLCDLLGLEALCLEPGDDVLGTRPVSEGDTTTGHVSGSLLQLTLN